MKTLKYCRTASFVPMMAFLIVFFVYRTLDKGFDGILATTFGVIIIFGSVSWKSPVCVTPEAQVPLTLESKFRMTPIKS